EETRHFEDLRLLCADTFLLASVPVFTDSFLNSFQTNPLWFFPRVLKGVIKHFRIRSLLNRAVREMILRHDPEVVQVEYTIMALYLRQLDAGRRRVLHLHDLMMNPYARLFRSEEAVLARGFRFLFYLGLKTIELRFSRSFDRVLVKSNIDKTLLLDCGR